MPKTINREKYGPKMSKSKTLPKVNTKLHRTPKIKAMPMPNKIIPVWYRKIPLSEEYLLIKKEKPSPM